MKYKVLLWNTAVPDAVASYIGVTKYTVLDNGCLQFTRENGKTEITNLKFEVLEQ